MVILGLTGSIGMGKSATADLFRARGIPVHDSDACVHALYRGKAVPLIEAAFPGTVTDNRLDRAALRRAVLGKPDALRRLEAIIHPMVRDAELAFLARARRDARRAAVLDIPLLLETAKRPYVDLVLVVSAPRDVQIHRVGLRKRMDRAQIEAVIARQMPDRAKQRHADRVVKTGLSRFHALRTLRRFLQSVLA
jgi:dephospho-CoA kinase